MHLYDTNPPNECLRAQVSYIITIKHAFGECSYYPVEHPHYPVE